MLIIIIIVISNIMPEAPAPAGLVATNSANVDVIIFFAPGPACLFRLSTKSTASRPFMCLTSLYMYEDFIFKMY